MWNDDSSYHIKTWIDKIKTEGKLMEKRPLIPTKLKRKVLVEAGHRCAIHTCRHPTTDLHHIIPWQTCKEHSYQNLIALCPNCHRRAESGEIDGKSLRLYKSRIAASAGISEHGPLARQFADKAIINKSVSSWVVEKISESYDSYPPYELDIEYVQFISDTEGIEQINVIQKYEVIEDLIKFRRLRLFSGIEPENWRARATTVSTLSESFEVSCFTPIIISVRYSILLYGAGAAHSNHTTRVGNYQLRPFISLELEDIFREGSPFLNKLSDFCIKAITNEKGESKPSEWTLEGAGPQMKNYYRYNLVKEGIWVRFDEYQVCSYGEGNYNVFVPKRVIKEYVNPKCRVGELWRC